MEINPLSSFPVKTFLLAVCLCISALPGRAQIGEGKAGNRASTLLTAALAQGILGVPVEASTSNTAPDTGAGKTWASRASYTAKSTEGEHPGITLLMGHVSTAAEAKDIFESNRDASRGVAVPGIGDAAYRTADPAQLNVLKGATWLIISAGTPAKPDTAAQEKAAKEILAKLAE